MPWHSIGAVRLVKNSFSLFYGVWAFLLQIIYVFLLIINLNPDILSKWQVLFSKKKRFWVFSKYSTYMAVLFITS